MEFRLERYPDNKNPRPIMTPRADVEWESKAVFNPSVVYEGGLFKMLYRTYPASLEKGEPRLKRPGFYFKNQISSIGYAESKNGVDFERRAKPFISPDMPYDQYGCEDPRMVKIGDTFYITYTAIGALIDEAKEAASIHNTRIALATTKDFVTVTKHGVIGPQTSSKAAAFFPEPVKNGKIGLLMTIAADSMNSRVVARYFDSIEDVFSISSTSSADTEISILKTESWLHRGPELGAAPIKTDRGWLLIFSAESMSDTWTIAAALLDLDDPDKLIARTQGSILEPVTDYERNGLVPDVTFPEGAVVVGDELFIYYGAADTVIGLAKCKLKDLLDYIESFRS